MAIWPSIALCCAAALALPACKSARASAGPDSNDLTGTLTLGKVLGQRGSSERAAPTRAKGASTDAVIPAADVAEPKAIAGCPSEMSQVSGFCVDRWEAVLVERSANGEELAHPAHERPVNGARYEARSKPGVLPQGYISQVEAADACENAGKRLCSATEWYAACRGAKQTTYPYGETYQRGKCNSGKLHLLGMWFGNDAHRWTYQNFNDPRLNREPGFLSPTGQYKECTNELGVYDLVGNLHEWVGDRVEPALAKSIQLVDGVRTAVARNVGHGVFMGGFFSTTAEQGPGCTFMTVGHEPKYHDYSTGFRCCKDAER